MNKILPISVIIPTYNESRYLPLLLESIHRQTLLPKEVIVADAKSTDNTRGIARKYNCKVITGGKPAQGRNNGAKAATQPLLMFLDADVILPTNFLVDITSIFNKKGLDLASCYFQPISQRPDDIFMHNAINYYYKKIEKIKPHIPGFCTLVTRKLHHKIGGYDESLFVSEDTDYSLRAAKKGKFEFLSQPQILVSVRRLDKIGRLKLAWQYFKLELHLHLKGPIKTNKFNYKFGGYDK